MDIDSSNVRCPVVMDQVSFCVGGVDVLVGHLPPTRPWPSHKTRMSFSPEACIYVRLRGPSDLSTLCSQDRVLTWLVHRTSITCIYLKEPEKCDRILIA